jgi:death on curing protein
MNWLTAPMVDIMHQESLDMFGGAPGIRDTGLLQSALARAENIDAYEPDADVFRLAAAYCAGIVKNHPFIDGNKRTGTLAMESFLAINDIATNFEEAMVVVMIVGLAAGEVSEGQLADWIRTSATKAR